MKNDPRNRRPKMWSNGMKCWHIKDSDAKALLVEETWIPDPENTSPFSDAYTNERGELLFHDKFSKSQLFESRQAYMKDLEEFRKTPRRHTSSKATSPRAPISGIWLCTAVEEGRLVEYRRSKAP